MLVTLRFDQRTFGRWRNRGNRNLPQIQNLEILLEIGFYCDRGSVPAASRKARGCVPMKCLVDLQADKVLIHAFQLAAGGENVPAARSAQEAGHGPADNFLEGVDAFRRRRAERDTWPGVQGDQIHFRIQMRQ